MTVTLRAAPVHVSSDSAVKLKESAPLALAVGVYTKLPLVCTTTLPFAG